MSILTRTLIDLEQFQINRWIAQQVKAYQIEGEHQQEFECVIDLCEEGQYAVYANCSFTCEMKKEKNFHPEVFGFNVETLYSHQFTLNSLEVEVLDREGDTVQWCGINSGIIKRYLQ